jgi:hypothetical protein
MSSMMKRRRRTSSEPALPSLLIFGRHPECGRVHPYPVPVDKAALASLVKTPSTPAAASAEAETTRDPMGSPGIVPAALPGEEGLHRE